MSPPSPHLPIFNFDFTTATSHKPAHSSPLSSSPIRASQSSPPLSPRDPNTLPRRGFFSSPINPAVCNQEKSSKWTKFETRDAKKNPLNQSRDNAVEGKRKLFLKNVRQRRDDHTWERRGGDQEILRLEWSNQDRKRRQQKERDLDGFMFEEDFEEIPDILQSNSATREQDDMMVDSHAMDEEAELEAMLSAYEVENTEQKTHELPDSSSLSDDDYDSIFMDLLSQDGPPPQQSQEDLVMSGQMDMS
ncbi:hypothetical protein PFICI_06692 [Pestalotiopsis fici W106-1]|uniref:Uncharacterized protein n=1 Tax=Pestalotiopsis fici (strain W106-1 / CGMCC3.15140) TaxID=1229662 RepID=W3X6M1_PESFW|nr:uncharacterized protein PFICI_06692 [Pestalotiopsis fici W106-1]ETS81690.1 hypothetical protein PFICI_06692 [Pestalotiopsis fici W106-1]